ncbi:MAG: HU family DNA-binding protein [Bacteroidota bacterium]|nr:HU family DNA-binding protein [Bacteroidota bacterium]
MQDLVDKLSEAGNCKKKEAEDFLRTYFKVIEDGLLQDRIVKINGLGTFKLIEVEARNSVDVNTGQTFQIKGHLKLNFIPDPQFKEKVNKPFAAFEPIETIDIEAKQKQTESSVKSEPLHPNVTDSFHESVVSADQVKSDKSNEQLTTTVEKATIPGIKTSIPDKPVPTNVENRTTETSQAKQATPEQGTASKEDMTQLKQGRGRTGKIILFSILILIIGALAFWAIKSNKDARNEQNQKLDIIRQSQDHLEDSSMQATNSIKKADTIASTAHIKIVKKDTAKVHTKAINATQFPVYLTIGAGNRLTLLAQKYYGHKVFWVYIYLENKDVITNPNNVPIGTKIRIPKPHPVWMDPNNPEAIHKAVALQYSIQKKFE